MWQNKLSAMDMLNILSFCISVQNLDENIGQNQLDDAIDKAIEDIHKHLQEQDAKIDMILEAMRSDKH